MEDKLIEAFLKWAKKNSWQVEENIPSVFEFPVQLTQRYGVFPKEWVLFISNVDLCANKEDTSWFLCANDYNINQDIAFRWNEFEIMSQEAAEGDTELIKEISSFWDKHLPIFLCVENDYAYYAICLHTKEVVMGSGPEFEEATVVASSFDEFLNKIMLEEIFL